MTDVDQAGSPVLRYIEMPPTPGARLVVSAPAGSELLAGWPPLPPGHGFAVDVNGDLWRSVLIAARFEVSGAAELLLEIEGRYPPRA